MKRAMFFLFLVLVGLFFCRQTSFAQKRDFSSSNLEESLKNALAENASLTKQNTNLLIKLKEDYNQQQGLIRQVKLLTEEREELRKRIEALGEIKSDLKSTWKDLGSLDKENRALSEAIAKANNELSLNQVKLSQKEEELNQLRRDYESTKSLREQIKKKSAKINELAEELKRSASDQKTAKVIEKELNRKLELLEAVKEQRDEYKEMLYLSRQEQEKALAGMLEANNEKKRLLQENAKMHYNLGNIFFEQKRYEQAIAEYERATDFPLSQYNLAIIYADYLKDEQKALGHYRQYLKLEPESIYKKAVEERLLHLEYKIKGLSQ